MFVDDDLTKKILGIFLEIHYCKAILILYLLCTNYVCLLSTGCSISLWRICVLLYGTISTNNWKTATDIIAEEIQSCRQDCQCCSKEIWCCRVKSWQRSKCEGKKRKMQNHLIWGHSRGRGVEDQGIKYIGNLLFKIVEYRERILNRE